MTADALKTITSPMKIKSRVTVNSQLSTLTRLAMERISFHHGVAETRSLFANDFAGDLTLLVRLRGQCIYCFLEDLTAVFVVSELVEAGTGGSEQYDIPGHGNLGRAFDCG